MDLESVGLYAVAHETLETVDFALVCLFSFWYVLNAQQNIYAAYPLSIEKPLCCPIVMECHTCIGTSQGFVPQPGLNYTIKELTSNLSILYDCILAYLLSDFILLTNLTLPVERDKYHGDSYFIYTLFGFAENS